MKNLYNLNLNEMADIGGTTARRVPGGWIYYTSRGVVFVPYHEEFKEKDLAPVDANNWPAGINPPTGLPPPPDMPNVSTADNNMTVNYDWTVVNNDIMVRGFKVTFPGEVSAGILEQNFDVYGPFYFESLDGLESFSRALADAFTEYAGEKPYIRTWEELQEK